MKTKILFIIISFALGFMVCKLILENKNEIKNIQTIKIDSVYVYKIPPKRKIDKIEGRITYTKDTILITKPFVSEIDTILNKDTLKMRYQFPENKFSFDFSRGLDSVLIEKMVIEKGNEENLLENILYILLGFMLGVLIK